MYCRLWYLRWGENFETPTYYGFDFYTVHHNAMLLPLDIQAENYEFKGECIFAINATASRDNTGAVYITATNFHATDAQEVIVDIQGLEVENITCACILTADEVDAINTFDNPDPVSPEGMMNIP